MKTHEWVIALIGGAIGIPAGMLSIAFYNPIAKLAEARSAKSAIKQKAALKAELEEVEKYRRDPGKFQEYLIARLLFITLLWIGQEAVDGIIGAATNIQYGLAVTNQGFNTSASLTAAGEALLASTLLTIVLLIGIRSYRIYRRVKDYDFYKDSVNHRLNRLEDLIKNKEHPQLPPQGQAEHGGITE